MQKKFENFNLTLDSIAKIYAKNVSPREKAAEVLETLGGCFNCQWATYWAVDNTEMRLRPDVTWTQSGFAAPKLNRDTLSRTLTLSEGTAGHVWRSRKPVWTLDLIRDMCLPRSVDAGNAGLNGGIWFAVKTEDTVYAIIELLGHDIMKPTQELVIALEGFGFQLGNLVKMQGSGVLDKFNDKI